MMANLREKKAAAPSVENQKHTWLEALLPISERECENARGTDFIAAKQEYDQSYDLMDLFNSSGSTIEARAEEQTGDEEPRTECDDEFVMTRWSRILVDGAVCLAARLPVHPASTAEERAALAKGLLGLARLPRPTPGLRVDFGFSIRKRGDEDLLYWSCHLDQTEVMWTAGGHLNGPAGPDSFTSFQHSLYLGAEEVPIGSPDAWIGCYKHAAGAGDMDVSATDGSDEDFWDRYA